MKNSLIGTYTNGVVTFEEPVPTDSPSKVLVTFIENPTHQIIDNHSKPVFGKGTFLNVSPDFDEPIDYLFEDFGI